jgi:hypothetical protein
MVHRRILNFKIFVLILKLKKHRVHRVIHSPIIEKYGYSENQAANTN